MCVASDRYNRGARRHKPDMTNIQTNFVTHIDDYYIQRLYSTGTNINIRIVDNITIVYGNKILY